MMGEVELAEKVIRLCPEAMGLNRTADQVVRDPRIVEILARNLEEAREMCNEYTGNV